MSESRFGQVTKAIVEEVGTDGNLGKVRIRIPVFHGPHESSDLLPSGVSSKYRAGKDDLPWAEVMYAPGTSPVTATLSEGEVVYVIFTSTSYRHPLVIGSTGRLI